MDPAQGVRRIPAAPHQLTGRVTPTAQLFTLAHFGIPRVDPLQWSLTIDGLAGPRRFRLDELLARPKRIVEAVHQCAGNPLEPAVPTRRVANLRWGGVDLAALLDEAGTDPRARFLWSYGLDGGGFAGTRCDWYVKDLPLARLAGGDVLLAHELNGAPLSAEHGYPLRLVVPGHYGTNSVKWLWRLRLAAERADGPFTTTFYNDPGPPARRPVWALAPEAVIVAPAPDAVLAVGRPAEIRGWAWSFGGIEAVEVSTDGGARFAPAALEPRRGWAWQGFAFPWQPAATGEAVLAVRAIAADGSAQPPQDARNAIHRVRVFLR